MKYHYINPSNEAEVMDAVSVSDLIRLKDQEVLNDNSLVLPEGGNQDEWTELKNVLAIGARATPPPSLESSSDQVKTEGIKNKLDTFNKYTNIRCVLDSLNKGGIIRQVFGRFVQVYSVIAGIALLIFWVRTFSALENMAFFQGVALIIWQLFFPVAAFFCLKAVFLRGADIAKLPDSEFVVSPIIALFITLHGEIVFIFLGIMSIPATLLVCLSASFIIPVETGDGFMSGIITFVGFWIVGFLFYCITRWIREWTMALFSIAQNVDLIRQTNK